MGYCAVVIPSRKSTLPRIVHLVTDLRLGGTQKMLLARVACCDGFEHHVWAPARVMRKDAPDLMDELRAAGTKLYVGRGGQIGSILWFFGALARSRWIRPAIVHSTLYHTHLVASYLAIAGGSSLVLGKESTDDWMTPRQARREASIAQGAAMIVAVSEAAARALESRAGGISTPVRIIPCGVPSHPPSWRVLPEEDDATRILYVGRLDPAKGLADLVEAVWHLLEEGRRIRLQVQGDGPAERPLREAFARPPLAGHARLITHSDLLRLDPASPGTESRVATPAIFVLPSRYEGFGVILLEAMQLELPIVATRVGGIPETVEEGKQALLVPSRDPKALADAIKRLLDDAELRLRLGKAGPDRARLFSQERMCDSWNETYRELLAGAS